MSEYILVDHEKLKAAVAAILRGEGVPMEDAEIVADSLVHADLTNLQSHGVQRVKFYTDSIELGGTTAHRQPQLRAAGRPGCPGHRGRLSRHGAGHSKGKTDGHWHGERP